MSSVIIVGISSDIGRELALRFARDGWSVAGTYRDRRYTRGLPDSAQTTECDLFSKTSVAQAAEWLANRCDPWDVLIIAAGTEQPIGAFWDCDDSEWEQGVEINSLAPLRIARSLYRHRNQGGSPSVAFFSGAGTNSAAPRYSAYCASKILLIKMCELLDAESEDTSFFILGPGIVRTRIHQQTIDAADRGGGNYRKVLDFLASEHPGTSHDEIYDCMSWCIESGKKVIGGRNISVVHDGWRSGGSALASWLKADANRFKLRRHGNDERIGVAK